MIQLDRQALQNIVILKRNPEFIAFLLLLERAKIAIALSNSRMSDEVMCRWNQGRVQELDDILTKIKTSDEDLKNFNTAPRKTPNL